MVDDGHVVTVSLVGTGSTSGGGVAPIADGTVLRTPEGQPNLVVNVVSPIIALVVRFARQFLLSFLASVGTQHFAGFGDWKTAAYLALGTSLLSLGWNLV